MSSAVDTDRLCAGGFWIELGNAVNIGVIDGDGGASKGPNSTSLSMSSTAETPKYLYSTNSNSFTTARPAPGRQRLGSESGWTSLDQRSCADFEEYTGVAANPDNIRLALSKGVLTTTETLRAILEKEQRERMEKEEIEKRGAILGPPSAAAASREGDESDASGDTNVLPSSPESEMSLSDDGGKEDASDPPTTAEFLANDLGMRMPELTDVLHEVKTDQHSIQTLRYSVHFKEEKSQKIFFEGGPAVDGRADGGAASANMQREEDRKRSSKKTKRRQKKAAKEYESVGQVEDAEDTGAKECSPYDVENEAYAEKDAQTIKPVVPTSPTAVPELTFFTCTKTCWYAPAVEVILDAPFLA
ncbi:hypothetical protein THAOC_13074 [Thalassiosira oceanica]|uniref:Uncharacterized protein n=1 Tax=Thalassiosira oceanica TaxID=159749 RepID=K0SM27_THAOC|nr:hypothetical protein THAOC_13074 [Thalassiosira oceanica]|eukprot:EJK66024.1 hypothetical protein THAOC_13074 [Thalassiosira oceanica]